MWQYFLVLYLCNTYIFFKYEWMSQSVFSYPINSPKPEEKRESSNRLYLQFKVTVQGAEITMQAMCCAPVKGSKGQFVRVIMPFIF